MSTGGSTSLARARVRNVPGGSNGFMGCCSKKPQQEVLERSNHVSVQGVPSS